MPALTASAPGKVILFGEHAVVYGKPAIAIPIIQVKAKATITANPRGAPGEVRIQAPDIKLDLQLAELKRTHPLAAAIQEVVSTLRVSHIPACTLRITSTIPIAAGLGSGAAVSVAIIRVLSSFLGKPLPDKRVSELAYEVEKLYHGTPSGIDNSVITYAKPVYYIKDQPIKTLTVRRPLTLVIGDTGIQSSTKESVSEVRKAWKAHKERYESYFDSIEAITISARQFIEMGAIEQLGPLMDANHGILRKIGVSSPELDTLIEAAHTAGAWGAKLCGGGCGGNMIALVTSSKAAAVAKALEAAGAVGTIITEVHQENR
jgi:mevalonate kinase